MEYRVATSGKEYNCPDCKVKENSCKGCQRYMDRPTNQPSDRDIASLWDYLKTSKKRDSYRYYDRTLCRNCANNPANGGSGICNCTLGGITWYSTADTPNWSYNPTYVTSTTYKLEDID